MFSPLCYSAMKGFVVAVLVLFICLFGKIKASSSRCTNSMGGLPSCNFDHNLCGYYKVKSLGTGGLKWTREQTSHQVKSDWQPPNKKNKRGYYVYLDVTNSKAAIGSKSRLIGEITSNDTTAVCIEFHYATSGPTSKIPQISVYNVLDGTDHLIGRVTSNSQGAWNVATFESCVGRHNSKGKNSFIAFEATKLSPKSFVAMDYVKITKSNKICKQANTPVTTRPTSPVPTRPFVSSVCTNSMAGLPSCHFDKNFCGAYGSQSMDSGGLQWTREQTSSQTKNDWQPAKTRGKRGYFVYLKVTKANIPIGSKARLNGRISSSSVKAVCIEFHYATSGATSEIPQISVYSVVDGKDHLIGRVAENTQGVWKVARINGCVGMPGTGTKSRRISFESTKLSSKTFVALDYIKVTKSNQNCRSTTNITTTVASTTKIATTSKSKWQTPKTRTSKSKVGTSRSTSSTRKIHRPETTTSWIDKIPTAFTLPFDNSLSSSNHQTKGLSRGAMGGIVAGGVVIVISILFLSAIYVRRRKRSLSREELFKNLYETSDSDETYKNKQGTIALSNVVDDSVGVHSNC